MKSTNIMPFQVILDSFPNPILCYEAVASYTFPEHQFETIHSRDGDKLVFSVLGTVHGKPQGDILHKLCSALAPAFHRGWFTEIRVQWLCKLLTGREVVVDQPLLRFTEMTLI